MLNEVDEKNYTSYSEMKNYVIKTLGSELPSHFGSADLLADIDAYLIAQEMITNEQYLSSAFVDYYYLGGSDSRYRLFIDKMGGEESFRLKVKLMIMINDLTEEEEASLDFDVDELKTLMLFLSTIWKHRPASETELIALQDGFVEVIMNRIK